VSYATFVARRAAFAVLAAYLVVSLTFVASALVQQNNLGGQVAAAKRAGASQEDIQELRQDFWDARGGKDHVQRYVDFVTGFVVLDWGESYALERPVTDVVAERLPYTLAYVVPGVFAAFLVGALLGVLGAFRRHSVFDGLPRVAAYLAMGVPSFWLVHYLSAALPGVMPWLQPTRAVTRATARISEVWSFAFPLRYAVPASVLSLGLVAGLLQHSRAESLEYERAPFVKLLEAKGASRLRVARHVLRNAAVPILTLSFVEVLGVLMLNVYILEAVFNIPGIGTISLYAIENQDTPLVVGTTMVLVLVGIGGNFLQDVLYGYLDPALAED
jgi:peptide/nickel transport system permease protein